MRLVFVTIACLVGLHPLSAWEIEARPQIVDGDTIYLGDTKIRLAGIDAPETDQRCLNSRGGTWSCGVESKTKLEEFSDKRSWVCQLTGTDRYGRNLGSCSINGEDVSRWLVRSGWALAFTRYSVEYARDEELAREEKRGLWSGSFIAPWDWRRRGSRTVVLGAFAIQNDAQRQLISPELASSAPSPDCVIKANFARRDQCIYHVPGGRFYDRLDMKPNPSRRWFCSEAEAVAAGCRKSQL